MITIKLEGIEEALKTLDPKTVQLAGRQAVNRAAQSGKSIASEEIRKTYNLKAGDLSPRLKVTPARMDNMTAVLEITGRPMSLSYFDAKQISGYRVLSRKGSELVSKSNRRLASKGPVPMGVTEQVIKGKRAFLGKAFLAKMKSGHIGVFVRKGKGRSIVEKNVITIPSMVSNAAVMPKVIKRIEERLKIELPQQLAYYFGKRGI